MSLEDRCQACSVCGEQAVKSPPHLASVDSVTIDGKDAFFCAECWVFPSEQRRNLVRMARTPARSLRKHSWPEATQKHTCNRCGCIRTTSTNGTITYSTAITGVVTTVMPRCMGRGTPHGFVADAFQEAVERVEAKALEQTLTPPKPPGAMPEPDWKPDAPLTDEEAKAFLDPVEHKHPEGWQPGDPVIPEPKLVDLVKQRQKDRHTLDALEQVMTILQKAISPASVDGPLSWEGIATILGEHMRAFDTNVNRLGILELMIARGYPGFVHTGQDAPKPLYEYLADLVRCWGMGIAPSKEPEIPVSMPIAPMRAELDDLRSQVGEHLSTIALLKTQANSLRARVEGTQAELEAAYERCDELETGHKVLKDDLAKVTEERDTARTDLTHTLRELNEQLQLVDQLKAEVEARTQECKDLFERNTELRREAEALKAINKELGQERDWIKAAHGELDNRACGYLKERNAANEDLEALAVAHGKLKTEYEGALESLNQCERALAVVTAERDGLGKACDMMNGANTRLTEKVTAAELRVRELEAKLAEEGFAVSEGLVLTPEDARELLGDEKDQKIAGLEESELHSRMMVDNMWRMLRERGFSDDWNEWPDLFALKEQVRKLIEKLTVEEGDNDRLSESNSHACVKLEHLRGRLKDIGLVDDGSQWPNVSELQKQVQELTEDLQARGHDVSDALDQKRVLEEKCVDLMQERDSLKEELDESRAETTRARLERESLYQQVRGFQDERNEYAKKIDGEYQAELSRLRKELEEWVKAKTELEKRLDEGIHQDKQSFQHKWEIVSEQYRQCEADRQRMSAGFSRYISENLNLKNELAELQEKHRVLALDKTALECAVDERSLTIERLEARIVTLRKNCGLPDQ